MIVWGVVCLVVLPPSLTGSLWFSSVGRHGRSGLVFLRIVLDSRVDTKIRHGFGSYLYYVFFVDLSVTMSDRFYVRRLDMFESHRHNHPKVCPLSAGGKWISEVDNHHSARDGKQRSWKYHPVSWMCEHVSCQRCELDESWCMSGVPKKFSS